MRTSAGTVFTRSPPFVMIGCTRTWSSSRKVSRLAWMAAMARDAAFSALTPSQGAPPACASLPRNRSSLPIKPPAAPATTARGCGASVSLCTIMAMSISSKAPSAMSCCLPPRYCTSPARLSPARQPISTYSSAGAASRHTLPARLSATARRPTAQPSMEASWALCPQAWAAPVALSANGWPGLSTASSSPITATRGPAPRQSQPFTPVRAGRVTSVRPSEAKASSTFPAVRVSL